MTLIPTREQRVVIAEYGGGALALIVLQAILPGMLDLFAAVGLAGVSAWGGYRFRGPE